MRSWIAVFLSCLPLAVWAQAEKKEPVKPCAEHALLKQFDGEWDIRIKGHAGATVQEGQGTESARLTLGSLWVECETQGTIGGKEFSGRGLIGYDPGRKKYVGVWADSQSPCLTRFEGDTDLPGRCFTFKVVRDPPRDAAAPGGSILHKLVYEFKDADHHTLRFFTSDGNATDVLITEMAYTRRPVMVK